MKSVWLVLGVSLEENENKNSGHYPFNSEYDQIIAICNSEDTAVSVANEHIVYSAKEAEEFYEGEGVTQIIEEAERLELKTGIAYLRVRNPLEPHETAFYYIKIKEQMVIEK